MDTAATNHALVQGTVRAHGVLPHLDALAKARYVFQPNFGLDALPEEPGVIVVRGPRQYGKSTWLEHGVLATVESFGPGSAFYLNGDELRDSDHLVRAIRELLPSFSAHSRVRRLFIDEITAVNNWQKAIKILADAGELRHILVVTTGSKAADLRHAAERLPGRKGRLARTDYLFAPLPFTEFQRVCAGLLGNDAVVAYTLAGGSPLACAQIAEHGHIPEFVIELCRDWIVGEFSASGRQRASLIGVMDCLHRFGASPVGQAKLAREAGLANNTVAAGYIELLTDLTCVAPTFSWDASRQAIIRRRPCKYPMINSLAAVAWHPARLRNVDDFKHLDTREQACFAEWLVAQELWRRAAVRGDQTPEFLRYYADQHHEIDFVVSPSLFVEVKLGSTTPLEFAWFSHTFPRARLIVISASRFETDVVRGITLEDFLLGRDADAWAG